MRREYENPPLNELVIGVYFKPHLLNLRSEHIGIFWKKVRDEFPQAQQQGPIREVLMEAPNEVFPMPRYWFVARDGALLLQIQRNAFIVNWRKKDKLYPHFHSVKNVFDINFGRFVEFLRSETGTDEVIIDTCELAYINMIESTGAEGWKGPAHIADIVPSYRPLNLAIDGGHLEGVNSVNVFRVAEDQSLTVKITTGTRTAEKVPVLIFEQRVSGQPIVGTKTASDAWFTRAHDVTGACFNSLTHPDIQKHVWRIKERP
jgi:uncharacterized protein (TIGR04255 family)